MTSLDRVIAALSGKHLDKRPPYTMTLSLYGARLTGCPLKEYYSNADRYTDGQVAVHKLCSPDILFSPFVFIFEAAAFGTQFRHVENGPPVITKPAVHSAEQFLELKVPDIHTNHHLRYIRESVQKLSVYFDRTVPVCGIVTSPVDLPAIIMGMDTWIETVINTPQMAKKVMDITTRHFVSFANALLEDGASFISIPMACTNPAFMFERLINDIFVPVIESACSQIKGPVIVHHGGNRLESFVDSFRNIPNAAGFSFDSRDSLVGARKQIGSEKCMLGNLNGPSLSSGTTESAIEKVRAILDNRKNDPSFIFATSGADIPWDTPPERIAAIAETVQSWGNRS